MNLKLNLDSVKKQLIEKKEKDKRAGGFNDPDVWKLPVKDHKGAALIRFLPGKDLESHSLVEYKVHSFNLENGENFYDFCPSTIGKPCPICDMNKKMWKLDKNRALQVMAKKYQVSNILVIKEPSPIGNPENEGKIFKFAFGNQLWKILEGALFPNEDMGDQPLYFMDFDKGADFYIESIEQGGFNKYDVKSKFKEISKISKDVHKLSVEEIYEKLWYQKDLFDVSQIKDYVELQEKYNSLKNSGGSSSQEKPKGKSKQKEEEIENGDEDDDNSFFKNIMAEVGN